MRYLVIAFSFFVSSALAVEPPYFQTPKDKIPNYAQSPTCESVKSGNWSNSSTWSCAAIPSAGAVVKVHSGHTVTYDRHSSAALDSLGVGGVLTFKHDIDTLMHVGTIMVYRDGELVVGTSSVPIAASKTAEIVFNDDEIDTVFDPMQYGNGFVVLGKITTHGRVISEPWQRLTGHVLADATSATIETGNGISDWAVGDKIMIPDSRHRSLIQKYTSDPIAYEVMQDEILEISAINATTGLITFTSAAQYDHKGLVRSDVSFEKYPHVGNITRNVIFRSADKEVIRAHGMITERAFADIRYTAFNEMGRTTEKMLHSTTMDSDGNVLEVGTNQIGRYPVHFHHNMGPVNASNTGYQGHFIGNAIVDGEKWPLAIHNSHWLEVSWNVFYDATGTLLMLEEGNERGNAITHNFGAKSGRPIKSHYEPRYGGVTSHDEIDAWHYTAYEGSGFWGTGKDNIVNDNVFASVAYAAFMINARSPGLFSGNYPRVPLMRGADIDNAAQWKKYHLEPSPEVLEMKNNEGYGGADCTWFSFSDVVGTIEDLTVWNCSQLGMYVQRNISATFKNFVAVNDFATTNGSFRYEELSGVEMFDLSYAAGNNTFDGGLIAGFRVGVNLPGFVNTGTDPVYQLPVQETTVKGMHLKNWVNIWHRSPILYPKKTIVEGVTFERETGGQSLNWLSASAMDVLHQLHPSFGSTRRLEKSEVLIFDYDGVGTDIEVFMSEQDPAHVMETTGRAQDNCPTSGYTNQQCMDTHSKATLGKLATCTDSTTHAYIDGFACDQSAPPPVGSLTASAGADVTVNEGAEFNRFVTVTGGTGTGRTYTVDWESDSTVDVSGSIPDVATGFALNKTYPDGAYNETVTITVSDDGSNTDTDSVVVTVANVAPSGVISGAGTVVKDAAYTVTATIAEPGTDTITSYILTPGDGSAAVTISAGNPLTYTYTATGSYTMSLSVVDEDGTHLIGTHHVDVTCTCS